MDKQDIVFLYVGHGFQQCWYLSFWLPITLAGKLKQSLVSVLPSVSLSVCFRSVCWADWPMNSSFFCACCLRCGMNERRYGAQLTAESRRCADAVAGARPKVRRRLRSRKMALWRDLIPRLHRADDFDSRLHPVSYTHLTLPTILRV